MSLFVCNSSRMDVKDICPRSAITFIIQVVAALVILIAAAVNLTLYENRQEVWVVLVSGAVGYLFPNPCLKKRKCQQQTT